MYYLQNINNKKEKNTILYIKTHFLIYCLILNIFVINNNNLSKIILLFSYFKNKNEIRKADYYFKLCNNLEKLTKYSKMNNPKVSIISPVYNRERYLMRFIKSIIYQDFTDIEIIFIDDHSSDNSFKIIEEYKIKDKRVVLIINKKNKGTFISRNIGIIFSKGKYAILPDPDDMVAKNILNICYNKAEKYKLEMIRFIQYNKNKKINNLISYNKKIIYQPELSLYIFYGNNELNMNDYFINNKFIKKDIFIKSLSLIKKYYLKTYLYLFEDQIINYLIHTICNSFYFLNKIGYYYIKTNESITEIVKDQFKLSELKRNFIFIYLKFLFKFTKNRKNQKDIANLFFTKINQKINMLQKLSKPLSKKRINYYNNIINIYINCKFISKENKFLLLKIRNKILYKLKKKKTYF